MKHNKTKHNKTKQNKTKQNINETRIKLFPIITRLPTREKEAKYLLATSIKRFLVHFLNFSIGNNSQMGFSDSFFSLKSFRTFSLELNNNKKLFSEFQLKFKNSNEHSCDDQGCNVVKCVPSFLTKDFVFVFVFVFNFIFIWTKTYACLFGRINKKWEKLRQGNFQLG